MICVISNHNHTNHTIILRTFHYYCYKSLHYILLFINKVLYGISFSCIEIPYYDFVIYDSCDCNLFCCIVRIHFFSFLGLVVAEAGVRWGLPPCAHNRLFGLSFCGTVDCERLCRTCCSCTPKNVGFEGIVINFAKKKKKASPASPPTPLRVERGVIREIPLSWW